jgi:predicted membrane-bound spermidine synthase
MQRPGERLLISLALFMFASCSLDAEYLIGAVPKSLLGEG